jgi:hypothetical protein
VVGNGHRAHTADGEARERPNPNYLSVTGRDGCMFGGLHLSYDINGTEYLYYLKTQLFVFSSVKCQSFFVSIQVECNPFHRSALWSIINCIYSWKMTIRPLLLRNNHVHKKALKAILRCLSSSKKEQDEELFSSLFENKNHGMQMAKLLSPSARLEITNASNTILSNEANSAAQELESVLEEPTSRQLRIHAFTMGIPFIGFGFMDNALMIVAGDYIDTHLGVLFGISTLCAAAIGNLVSDVAGVGLGAYVEDFCATKLKLPSAELNNAQRQLRSVRFAGNFGTAIGLTIGCILGMFPLLFIDPEEVQRRKKESNIDILFRDVMTEAKSLVGADSTCLFLLVDKETSNIPSFHSNRDDSYKGKYLKSKYFISDEGPEKLDLFSPLGPGLVSKCILSGQVLNVPDVHQDPAYEPKLSVVQHLHSEVKAMLLVPVYDVHGNVIAVLQATNKVRKGTAEVKLGFLQRLKSNISGDDRTRNQADVFSAEDERVLRSLATHISVSLQNMNSNGDASLKEVVQILKEHGTLALRH